MKRTTVTIVTLSILLVATNLWWLFGAIDSGVTQKYEDIMLHNLRNSRKQALSMLNDTLRDKNKAEVKEIAAKYTDLGPYEKEGCLWVGWYGFKFSEEGKFEGIETSESYNNNPLCDVSL